MPSKRANVKNEKQYEKLKEKGMSKERAAKNAAGSSPSGSASSTSTRRSSPEPLRREGSMPQTWQTRSDGSLSQRGRSTRSRKEAARRGHWAPSVLSAPARSWTATTSGH